MDPETNFRSSHWSSKSMLMAATPDSATMLEGLIP